MLHPSSATANRVCSPAQPALCLPRDHTLAYEGGPTFELDAVVQFEQHLFVEADAQHRVRRLFWAQKESQHVT